MRCVSAVSERDSSSCVFLFHFNTLSAELEGEKSIKLRLEKMNKGGVVKDEEKALKEEDVTVLMKDLIRQVRWHVFG